MRRYKWYLLVNFTLSYAFSAGNVLFEPMPLLDKVVAIYFDGLLKNFGFWGTLLAIGTYCSIAVALPFTMLYRFLQQYHNFLQRLFTETYLPLILLAVFVLGLNIVLYFVSIVIGNYTSGNYTKILIDESPSLLPYEDKPSFIAIPMSGIVELFGILSSLAGIGMGNQNQTPIAFGMNQMKLNHRAAHQTPMNPRV
uniref:Uncharacterized protein n=1 Tax=Acrobeloides nanus TaxID=290746 RepID=A0A914DQV8_9BILA